MSRYAALALAIITLVMMAWALAIPASGRMIP